MERVDVTVASPRERPVIENLMQLYIHDFSENWSGTTDRGEVGEDGRFAPYPLESYWVDPSHSPLLFRITDRIVGFSLLNGESHRGAAVDRNVAEFFVLRKYRRGGVGTQAAHAMFARFPGVWEAAVVRTNTAALAFWRSVIESCPGARDVREVDVSSELWNGPVLGFRC
jgi:predicted acetyltransferase